MISCIGEKYEREYQTSQFTDGDLMTFTNITGYFNGCSPPQNLIFEFKVNNNAPDQILLYNYLEGKKSGTIRVPIKNGDQILFTLRDHNGGFITSKGAVYDLENPKIRRVNAHGTYVPNITVCLLDDIQLYNF